jgi:hypothetical protein
VNFTPTGDEKMLHIPNDSSHRYVCIRAQCASINAVGVANHHNDVFILLNINGYHTTHMYQHL